MSDNLTLKENLKENFFKRNCFLMEEPEAFIKQELINPENYYAILKSIAGGASTFNTISTGTGLTASSLTDNLKKLSELGIVDKVFPLGVKKRNASVYRIIDGLFAFWFKLVPKNLIYIEQDKFDIIWDVIQDDLHTFTSKVFEKFTMEWIKHNIGSDKFSFIIGEIGSWWGRNPLIQNNSSPQHEIDIVAFGQKSGDVLLAECKWRNRPTGSDVIDMLIAQSNFFPAGKRDYFIFSKSSFTQEAIEAGQELNIKLVPYNDMLK
jgi:AAA+ ATPase superfamily predicted ATPase